MYFEIENTPEHIKRARRATVVKKESPKEECPRLILAPFSRPPQVVFENVLIGTSCERNLEIYNPLKQPQQITLGRALPPGLLIHLPGEWLELEPETCYCLTMVWSPTQPTALRETVRFTNENRGRYDVIVVLRAVVSIKGKGNQPKGFKISPGKIKKKVSKKSPVAIYKKKAEVIYNTTKIKKTVSVVQSTHHRVLQPSNKENISMNNDYSIDSHTTKCPFDSPTSIDFNFDTSEVFSNLRKTNNTNVLQKTYDKSYTMNYNNTFEAPVPQNVLKPSNKQKYDTSGTDIFDNLTFTPLKSLPGKNEKLDKGPKIILSMNSESDFDDSLDMHQNKENQTHSIITITSSQPPNKWLTVNHHTQIDSQVETPTIPSKKIPNTSSPKEFNSPNFSINTDFSRISDLSFFPQRFSTERKVFPKSNESHDIIDDMNHKLSSDTYTKESPQTPMDQMNQMFMDYKPNGFFVKEQQPKMCRQALFKEHQQQKEPSRNYLSPYERNVWHNDFRSETKSPPRSITPPLQSIPEESTQFSDTQILDRTDKQMTTFTINRTFDKQERSFVGKDNIRQSWSKKAVRVEPDLWKVPAPVGKKSLKPRPSTRGKESFSGKTSISNTTFDADKSVNQSVVNRMSNVYSQSFTVDPFMSTTYFYDEASVDKFEKEFKRWLNCILTPPAELDSNIEIKIDVGKAWIENRNKEVPAAPTKEQVCSMYHTSHRLESLRRAARSLFKSSEIVEVFQKLSAQIEKKLIAIRTDKNLHLDIGLQKVIMELLLSYNPLWLRIGLEAIYGIVLPLKSNNDIEGLTLFIIQRMFKNPYLKNKHSKSSAPNMLLPAYMEAIKKFTLKKFFMLVFFLDQAKQRKLISHDPCLFCRNAVCKESREVIIRFTRELIAGIGDITKHLRPLGYVVSHKQSYLDEYKYAVHNIAADIRDGVRLTKVMEIILMKNGLLSQLRTPAISRLQKIHNVQVALNALKEANFIIVGDISAQDIADGHREKTLSLLWQLIHVFRAPLFERAANVIQTWWRKKYEVIVEKRKEEERIRQHLNKSASVIQLWWRRIQYNRLMKWKMEQITTATMIIQKYCKMWLCRREFKKIKTSVVRIEEWYRSIKMMREAKQRLLELKSERDELRRKAAILIQTHVRRTLCIRKYDLALKRIVVVQSLVRAFLIRKWYTQLKKSVVFVQQKYRSKLLMRKDAHLYSVKRNSIIAIQSIYRMLRKRRSFLKLKQSVTTIEERYLALRKMREERVKYLKMKENVILVQAIYRSRKCRLDYVKQRNLIIKLQQKIRAHQLMQKQRANYLQTRKAAVVIQTYVRAYQKMKITRQNYTIQRKSAVVIQKYFRGYLQTKIQRNKYVRMREAVTFLQRQYRSLLAMRRERIAFLRLKNGALFIQRQYRAQIMMRNCRHTYEKLRKSAIVFQRRYRAQIQMRNERSKFQKLKLSCITIQNAYRAYILGKTQRQNFLKQKQASTAIQKWYRNCKKGKLVKQEYQQTKQACVIIQNTYRAYVIGKKVRQEYLRIKTAIVCIQKYYRTYIEMKTVRQEYIKLKTATVSIQKFYRSCVETKKQRNTYLRMKSAVTLIENYYALYKQTRIVREKYCKLKKAVVYLQRKYRSICAMRHERENYLKLRQSVITIQHRYRALVQMRQEKQNYLMLRTAAITIQRRYRAQILMKQERNKYINILKSCKVIQTRYRAYVTGKKQKEQYLKLKQATEIIQRQYKAMLAMRRDRKTYLKMRSVVVFIQQKYRAKMAMLVQKHKYQTILKACVTIQRWYKAHLVGKIQRFDYVYLRSTVIKMQQQYRLRTEYRKIRHAYIQLRNTVIMLQRRFRAIKIARDLRRDRAVKKIQTWYRSVKKGIEIRNEFLKLRNSAVIIQSLFRSYVVRKRYVTTRNAILTIQRYFRSYKMSVSERQKFIHFRKSVVKVQATVRSFVERRRYLKIRSAVLTIQAAYRLKKQRDLVKARREKSALCIQKNVRRFLAESRYKKFRHHVLYVQRVWRGKLLTRLIRCEYLQKRRFVITLQSVVRGYLVRKQVQNKREYLIKIKEEKRRNWAASKIQALFRGHMARVAVASDKRVAELRRRWRAGALLSTQESMKERNEEAMEVLRNMSDIETVIRAFHSLELLTEVFPMMYNHNASPIVRRVYIYMSVTNRSISSIEVLKSAASVLVNLTRYKITGPKIYARDRIPPILKFMWRFSNTETQLFCILSTYIWLFSKYENIYTDLKAFLHEPDNHKMLVSIKGNIGRMKRMVNNSRNKFSTPQPSKIVSRTNQSLNYSVCSTSSNSDILLPALEPDYGIVRADKPRYFEDTQQAINCLFQTYNL